MGRNRSQGLNLLRSDRSRARRRATNVRGVRAEPTESVTDRAAELEALRAELAQARARLLEVEQELADLPRLRLRNALLEEAESSPVFGRLLRARDRFKRRSRRAVGGRRRQVKRVITALIDRVSPDPDREPEDPDRKPGD